LTLSQSLDGLVVVIAVLVVVGVVWGLLWWLNRWLDRRPWATGGGGAMTAA